MYALIIMCFNVVGLISNQREITLQPNGRTGLAEILYLTRI